MDFANPITYGVILAVVTAVGTVLWKVFWWVAKIDPLPAGFSESTKQFLDFTKEIRDDVKQIFLRLPPIPVTSNSPLQLTEFGEKIAALITAREWASSLAPSLRADVTGKPAFEIDQFSDVYVNTRLTDEMKQRVAACGYEFGTEQSNVLKVLQVVLRDALLESDPSQSKTP